MTQQDPLLEEARSGEKASRRSFLGKLAGAAAVGLAAPLAAGARPGAAPPAAPAQGLAPPLGLPPAVEGEHPVERMMADLRRALQKPMAERQWAMVIDLRKCTGCNGCNIACVSENKLPPGVSYRPVMTETQGTYPRVARRFVPRPCLQCQEPPCVSVCPVKATYKRSDGITVVDYDRCIGCRYCMTACPYSARSFDFGTFYGDSEGGERQPYELLPSPEYGQSYERTNGGSPVGNVRKCHFCIHRIERGELPACVLSCMGRATYFGDAADPDSLISTLIAQPNIMRLKEELGTDPSVFYLV
jgi:Fe-S-cluster-containing dehydrogenase component